jgi:hypothetical protein
MLSIVDGVLGGTDLSSRGDPVLIPEQSIFKMTVWRQLSVITRFPFHETSKIQYAFSALRIVEE